MMYIGKLFDEIYRYRFVILLLALITYLFVPSFFSPNHQKMWLDSMVRSLLFISTIGVVWKESRPRRMIVFTIIGILVIMTWIANKTNLNPSFEIAYLLLALFFFVLIGYAIVVQIVEHDRVDLQIVASVLCGYLVLGVLGLFMFSIIYIANPEAFSITVNRYDDLLYYTFITMTTIGYGDVLPLTSDSKSAAVLLGIAGQFYTTVVIALIVGKFLQDITTKE